VGVSIPTEKIFLDMTKKHAPVETGEIPTLRIVAQDDVAAIAPEVKPFLYGIDTCSAGMNTLDSALECCVKGISFLGVYTLGEDEDTRMIGATLFDVIEYPEACVLRCWAVGGDIRAMAKIHTQGDAFARKMGCTHYQIEGPPWISNFLEGGDMKLERVIYQRPLYKEE
jgi:hypothetical protein